MFSDYDYKLRQSIYAVLILVACCCAAHAIHTNNLTKNKTTLKPGLYTMFAYLGRIPGILACILFYFTISYFIFVEFFGVPGNHFLSVFAIGIPIGMWFNKYHKKQEELPRTDPPNPLKPRHK